MRKKTEFRRFVRLISVSYVHTYERTHARTHSQILTVNKAIRNEMSRITTIYACNHIHSDVLAIDLPNRMMINEPLQ